MKKRGISLIVLIITIVIMGILLSAVVLSMRDEDISTKANETKIKNDVASIKEELQNYISHMEHEFVVKGQSYSKSKLNADKDSATYNGNVIEGVNNIYDILPSMNRENYIGAFKIDAGKLVFVTTSEYNFSIEEQGWINEIVGSN